MIAGTLHPLDGFNFSFSYDPMQMFPNYLYVDQYLDLIVNHQTPQNYVYIDSSQI